jgi:hypothetical protein
MQRREFLVLIGDPQLVTSGAPALADSSGPQLASYCDRHIPGLGMKPGLFSHIARPRRKLRSVWLVPGESLRRCHTFTFTIARTCRRPMLRGSGASLKPASSSRASPTWMRRSGNSRCATDLNRTG